MSSKKQKRDYKAEYKRRIERGLAKGLSRSQARGHPKAGEKYVARPRPIKEEVFQIGLKELRSGKPLYKAAKEIRVSPQRLRNQARAHGLIEKDGRRWVVKNDLPREMLIYSNGDAFPVIVGTLDNASKIGRYMAAVKRFLRNNDVSHIESFIGQSVQDIKDKTHIFETDPNTLYRIAASGSETFEQIYRIII